MERKFTHIEYHCLYDEHDEMFVYSDGEYAVYSNHPMSGFHVDPENCDHIKKELIMKAQKRLAEYSETWEVATGTESLNTRLKIQGEEIELEDLNKLIVVKYSSAITIEHITHDFFGKEI